MSVQQETENVRMVEDLAHKGNVDAAAKVLHDMPLAERAAVARQIRSDEMSKSDPSLPKMEFTNDGDLKSADVKVAEGPVVHNEYNSKTGNVKSREYKDDDGSVKHAEYDSVSGLKTPLSVDITRPDGEVVHRELDHKTGKLKYVDTKSH
jgi:hypothetical protein